MHIKSSRGFSLIELSVVMVIVGLLVAGGIQLLKITTTKQLYDTTKNNLGELHEALADFVSKNGRLPCPAPANAPVDSAAFRMEDCSITSVPGGRDTVADADSAPDPVLIGTIPTRTLSIADNVNSDGWKQSFTYAVSRHLTNVSTYDERHGAINLVDKAGNPIVTPASSGQYTIFSHGENGTGAYTNTGVAKSACAGAQKDIENCDGNSIFVSSPQIDMAAGANYYDDIFDYDVPNPETTIPTGAIMPFDLASCPPGWSDYAAARGRVVLGAGAYVEGATNYNYALHDTGGEAMHTLTLAETPAHTHNVMDNVNGDPNSRAELDWTGIAVSGAADTLMALNGDDLGPYLITDSQGGGQAHENRQPYVALKYCRKD